MRQAKLLAARERDGAQGPYGTCEHGNALGLGAQPADLGGGGVESAQHRDTNNLIFIVLTHPEVTSHPLR